MIVTVHIIIFLGYAVARKEQIDMSVQKYKKTLHYIHDTLFKPPLPPKLGLLPPPPKKISPLKELSSSNKLSFELSKYDMEIASIPVEKLNRVAKLMGAGGDWKMYEYKGYNYFYIWDSVGSLTVKDNIKNINKTQYIIFLAILLNIVFISFYIFLIKKLKPLRTLKKNIMKFSKGDLDIDTSCDGKGEICEVSNEFNNAIIQIKYLMDSRDLFLRNILHELKTPITKGFLITDVMSDDRYKEGLKRAFSRLDYLLKEFARLEEFTAKNRKLKKEEFRLVDIIDHALDILLCDTKCIDLEVVENILVKVDFELFSLAIKNLLDNAIKYGIGEPKVFLKNGAIYIINRGNKLSKRVEQYNKPFDKKYESSKSGLGLGLYLINNILNAHGFKLRYKFVNNKNIFFIKFKGTRNSKEDM